ncbi:MAG: helix-turn-helix transcriptional regulator [Candidatus Eremiobacteraeota bacterium]|nr:helix-turn-helix transcriptional regulator [Candidatus Eremiobacteraeota bacterium]MBV9408207.1 helix-turn-helix transcriptional regulator [Candidatus Eremiobacteraeota bacterium]
MGAMAIPDLARLAAALADPVRAAMVGALFGGVALPQQELARHGGVAPSTASEHLARLVDVGLLVRTTAGRRRYYRLVGPEVAEALERLGTLAPPAPRPRTLSQNDRLRVMTLARTCYDHLAGVLGVALADVLVADGTFARSDDDAFVETQTTTPRLERLGIDVGALRTARRPLVRGCLDWTERRPHLAGAIGAALADTFLARSWVRRATGHRGLHLTEAGTSALTREFGINLRMTGSFSPSP